MRASADRCSSTENAGECEKIVDNAWFFAKIKECVKVCIASKAPVGGGVLWAETKFFRRFAMKKLLSLLLALMMVFSLAACGNSNSDAPADEDAQTEGEDGERAA